MKHMVDMRSATPKPLISYCITYDKHGFIFLFLWLDLWLVALGSPSTCVTCLHVLIVRDESDMMEMDQVDVGVTQLGAGVETTAHIIDGGSWRRRCEIVMLLQVEGYMSYTENMPGKFVHLPTTGTGPVITGHYLLDLTKTARQHVA